MVDLNLELQHVIGGSADPETSVRAPVAPESFVSPTSRLIESRKWR